MTSKEIRKNYYALLKTAEWIWFSRQIIEEPGECENCGEVRDLQCHHKGYRDILPWEYNKSEIAVLCRSCHETVTANADELWNEAMRYLSAWEIYSLTKAIKERDSEMANRLVFKPAKELETY